MSFHGPVPRSPLFGFPMPFKLIGSPAEPLPLKPILLPCVKGRLLPSRPTCHEPMKGRLLRS